MLRLLLSIALPVFVVFIWTICEYFYPGEDQEMVLKWDKLKHILYLVGIFGTGLMFYLKPGKYEKWVRLLFSIFIFWIIPTMIFDKRNSYAPQTLSDFAFLPFAIYFGCKDIAPRLHKRIALIFISEKWYNKIC